MEMGLNQMIQSLFLMHFYIQEKKHECHSGFCSRTSNSIRLNMDYISVTIQT